MSPNNIPDGTLSTGTSKQSDGPSKHPKKPYRKPKRKPKPTPHADVNIAGDPNGAMMNGTMVDDPVTNNAITINVEMNNRGQVPTTASQGQPSRDDVHATQNRSGRVSHRKKKMSQTPNEKLGSTEKENGSRDFQFSIPGEQPPLAGMENLQITKSTLQSEPAATEAEPPVYQSSVQPSVQPPPQVSSRPTPSYTAGNRFQSHSRHKIPHAEFDLDSYRQPGPPHNQGHGNVTVHRKIYDTNHHPGLPPPSRDVAVPLREQCDYLGEVAAFQIPNTEITLEELHERENLRLGLQELCRHVISYHARKSKPDFNPQSVELRCFGSLRSGFATRSSDMDLALVSPESDYDPQFDDTVIPRLIEQLFLVQGYGARLLTRTRVPILRFCERPTPELLQALMHERLKWEELQSAHANVATGTDKSESKSASPVGASATSDDDKLSQSTSEAELHDSTSRSVSKQSISPIASASSPNGGGKFFTDKTDEDLVRLYNLAIKEGWFSPLERQAILDFTQCFYEAGANKEDENLVKARNNLAFLPNVLSRYREPQDNRLEFPKSGVGVQCDVNFSNPLALHNTQLLRCYTLCNDQIRKMVLFVKAWAKKRDINTPYKGTLSSYGYVLMVLHYVVNIANPPLAPNLQLQTSPVRGGSQTTEKYCMGHNVQFWRNERQIRAARDRGQLGYSKESLGSLLRGFFQYYAEQGHPNMIPRGGFAWTREVLSLRTEGGLLTKQEKGWTGARTDTVEPTITGERPVEIRQRFLFAIEDPFEIEHNVARPVSHSGICAIRDEFRRANRIIKAAGIIDSISLDLFQECKHQELDRELRYFGPNPANAFKPKFSGQFSGPKPSGPNAGRAGPTISGPRADYSAMRSGPRGPADIFGINTIVRARTGQQAAQRHPVQTPENVQALKEMATVPNEELSVAGLVGATNAERPDIDA